MSDHHKQIVESWYRQRGLTPPTPKSDEQKLADLQRQIAAMRADDRRPAVEPIDLDALTCPPPTRERTTTC